MDKDRIKKDFPFFKNENYKPYRLICFHHAGGTAAVFRNWVKKDPMTEVLPIEVKGGGIRYDEVDNINFENAAKYAAESIAEIYDGRDTYIYGHSLGSIFAFDAVCRLKKEYGIEIKKLIVAGRHAPFAEDTSSYRCSMGMEALKDELLRVGGTPKELLESDSFCRFMLPSIYADYKLGESYSYNGERVEIPIIALSGKNDTDADERIMNEWKRCTSGQFSQYSFEGGHFFPYNESEKAVLSVIFDELYGEKQVIVA